MISAQRSLEKPLDGGCRNPPKTTLPLSWAALLSDEAMAATKCAATTAAFAATNADRAIESWQTMQDRLEALPSASALKNEGDAGEGTRAFHLPRRGSGARVFAILSECGNGSR